MRICAPPRPIGSDDFFTACQRVVGVHTTADDTIAWAERRGHRVRIELHDGEVRFDSTRPWVVTLAVQLAGHLRGSVADTWGGAIWGATAERHPRHHPVVPETDIDGQPVEPDFSESALILGWPPLSVRESILQFMAAALPQTRVIRRRGELWVSWTGHPHAKQVLAILSDDGQLRYESPDVPTARWLVEVAAALGTVCTDPHGLVWEAADDEGVRPMWPEAHPQFPSTVHALLAERSRRALDLQSELRAADADAEEPQVPVDAWWQTMLSRAG